MFRLLKNGDVYAPEHIGKADILICNDKIVDIAEHIDFDYPGTEVVDLEGRKVIPGVIDQHIHVTGGGGESGFTSKVTEVGLSDLVRGGVCTLVGVLGTDSISRNVESLLAKVKALNEEGLTALLLHRLLRLSLPHHHRFGWTGYRPDRRGHRRQDLHLGPPLCRHHPQGAHQAGSGCPCGWSGRQQAGCGTHPHGFRQEGPQGGL